MSASIARLLDCGCKTDFQDGPFIRLLSGGLWSVSAWVSSPRGTRRKPRHITQGSPLPCKCQEAAMKMTGGRTGEAQNPVGGLGSQLPSSFHWVIPIHPKDISFQKPSDSDLQTMGGRRQWAWRCKIGRVKVCSLRTCSGELEKRKI